MADVTIDGEDYVAYAAVEDADVYAGAASHATTWRAETDDDVKGRALVTSTRTLDRQVWKEGYTTFAEREAVPAIINASIELAFAIKDGSEVQSQQTTTERVKSISAGSVSITNFWTGATETAMRFPLIVQELLLPYLGGSAGTFGVAVATGVDGKTIFPVELGSTGG